ncbi:MAG: hypothetical protein VB031_08790 [Eubacteriaceae bacterium]|nr:hypothetical protein [Eubacteriaceae bacterium]
MKLKKQTLIIAVIALCILSANICFAQEGYCSVFSTNVSFVKSSATSAKASVSSKSNGAADKMKATLRLQVYSTSKGKYVNSSADPVSKTVSSAAISFSHAFKISPSKKYRIKITVSSTTGSQTFSKNYYKVL